MHYNYDPILPVVSNKRIKMCKKDRNKLHITLQPGVPSPLGCDGRQDDVSVSGKGGCQKSEEGQYVEMRQTGTLRQQVVQPYHVM